MDNFTLSNNTMEICVDKQQTAFFFAVCILLAIVTVITLCGNLLVIISIAFFHQLHTLTNCLVLSLAVSDLLVGVGVLPFVMFLFTTPCSPHHENICRVKSFFDSLLCFASILNLYCICIERYYAVCRPLSYHRKINSRVIAGMIFTSWSVATALALVLASGGKNKEERCAITQNMKLSVVAAVFVFYIPAVVMLTLYTRILLVVRRQARCIQNVIMSEGVSKPERKATLMLAMVICVFLISWAPFSICVTYRPYFQFWLPLPMLETFKFLGWLNSTLNPFLYAYSHSWFKCAFRLVLTGKIFTGTHANARLD